MMVLMFVIAGFAFVSSRRRPESSRLLRAPGDLKAPIAFGLLYAVVLFLISAAQDKFGISGMFAVAAFSGLTIWTR